MRLRTLPAAILLATAALALLGCAGIARADEIVEGANPLVRQQVVWLVLGAVLATSLSALDYGRLAAKAPAIYLVVIAGLIAVFMFPSVNGAHRWVRVGGIGLQPSEFGKLSFIIALAAYLTHRELLPGVTSFVWPLALAVVPMLFILKEPDLGTSLVFVPVLFAMLWTAGARQRDLWKLVAIGIALVPLVWSQMSQEQRSRVTALWEQNGPRESPTPDGFHLDQTKRMFAIGGVWGTVFDPEADDDLPAARVPEPHTDSVFCVIGERYGLVGAAVVILLFNLLIGSCLVVAAKTEEPFGRLIAVGVAALFAGEVLVNTGMLVGLLPITGVSLPLVSYGGSGLIAHLLALGLVLNIAQSRRIVR